MITYIESNFVVEMALEQEQMVPVQAILDLAENKRIKLIFPNFVFSEPFERILRERTRLHTTYPAKYQVIG